MKIFSPAPPMTIVVECKWMCLIDEDTLVVSELHDNLKLLVEDGGLGTLLYHFEVVTCIYIKRAHPTSLFSAATLATVEHDRSLQTLAVNIRSSVSNISRFIVYKLTSSLSFSNYRVQRSHCTTSLTRTEGTGNIRNGKSARIINFIKNSSYTELLQTLLSPNRRGCTFSPKQPLSNVP